MPERAPRLPWRPLRRLLRGALVSVCLLPASLTSAQQAVDARYEGETTRYPHGVLGDEIEYDTLAVTLSDGRILRRRWETPLVFEDIAPRLWDVTGDGRPEVVTVESHEARGARLAIWTVENGDLRPLAATPFIGQRFRWLAPIGAADLDGDGHVEIAYVDRPHLAKTLRVWRYRDGGLSEVAALAGFSNHRIGWDYIVGGLRDCGEGPEMVLPSGDWRHLMIVRFDGKLERWASDPYSPEMAEALLACD
ncbi:VCBS repeat-containing protein [Mameliella alba]|nr:VCBS repeat-containing protein [Antarctobacter heliothermus]MBY6146218.1 VCBS repeat-containing protein [Mameliella alba]MCA0955403.1 VCBS repeat-containing protein [Mameliella alba]